MVLREKALATTASGVQIDLLNPNPADIRIEDIAHQLSQQPRFAGATRIFYSVGQHSLMVARSCPESERLWGLLHDAAEAYLSDLVSPIKRHFRDYIVTEGVLMRSICGRFGLTWPMPQIVKQLDKEMCELEKAALIPCTTNQIGQGLRFDEQHWEVTRNEFLKFYEQYKVESAEALRMLSLARWTNAGERSGAITMRHPLKNWRITIPHPARTIPDKISREIHAALQGSIVGDWPTVVTASNGF